MLPNKLNYKNFRFALAVSLVLAAIILGCSFYLGKQEFFLLLNTDLGKFWDFFFQYFTNMGDGLLWIIWLGIIIWKRKALLPLIISSFILTTIFTQVFKYVILPDEDRPSAAIADQSQIHFVKGVEVHSINSFPSGHTATAFTFVLLIALTIKRWDFIALAFVVALLVGYSRIYLGQHFPLDVGAGIIVAAFSVTLSIIAQNIFDKRRAKQEKVV